jgi:hypothetical protein
MDAEDLQAFGEDAALVGEALWPATVTIDGVDYPAEVPEPRARVLAGMGGDVLEAELVVRIRKSVLPDRPAKEKIIRYDGKRWAIREPTGNACDAVWTLRCESAN